MPFLEMSHISYLHSYIQRKDIYIYIYMRVCVCVKVCVCVCLFEVFEVIYFDFL